MNSKLRAATKIFYRRSVVVVDADGKLWLRPLPLAILNASTARSSASRKTPGLDFRTVRYLRAARQRLRKLPALK